MDYGAKSCYLIKPNQISGLTNFIWNCSNELLFYFFFDRLTNVLYNINSDVHFDTNCFQF